MFAVEEKGARYAPGSLCLFCVNSTYDTSQLHDLRSMTSSVSLSCSLFLSLLERFSLTTYVCFSGARSKEKVVTAAIRKKQQQESLFRLTQVTNSSCLIDCQTCLLTSKSYLIDSSSCLVDREFLSIDQHSAGRLAFRS